jgi:dTMP kinase
MTGAKKGFLISIEGIDGSGKTTQIRMLKEWLGRMHIDSVVLKEPTKGKYGAEITRLAHSHSLPGPEKELELFMLDRIEDVEKNILPALNSGKIVIMDRYYGSNMAYQGAKGIDPEKIRQENEKFSPVPDLVLILDIEPGRGLSRIVNDRKSTLDHFESEEYLKKVRKIFLDIGKMPNAEIIDASDPVDVVHKKVIEAVCKRMKYMPI